MTGKEALPYKIGEYEMPISEKRREYERNEVEKFHISVPKFLATALREKLAQEGRTPHSFFIDAAAKFCGMEVEIKQRRSTRIVKATLRSPDGKTYEISNLKKFVRENQHLFPGVSVIIAYEGLSGARRRKGSWHGWRFKS